MKQTTGVNTMEKEDKQELVAADSAPSTVVVMPERDSDQVIYDQWLKPCNLCLGIFKLHIIISQVGLLLLLYLCPLGGWSEGGR